MNNLNCFGLVNVLWPDQIFNNPCTIQPIQSAQIRVGGARLLKEGEVKIEILLEQNKKDYIDYGKFVLMLKLYFGGILSFPIRGPRTNELYRVFRQESTFQILT